VEVVLLVVVVVLEVVVVVLLVTLVLLSALGVPQTLFTHWPDEVYQEKSVYRSIEYLLSLSPAGQSGLALTPSTNQQSLFINRISSLEFLIEPT